MSNDQYQEILIVICSGVVLFILLVGVIVFTMLYHQKKKFQHHQEKQTMDEAYHKQLLQARLEMQEATFNTISREIHDNVGQLLSLAKVQLNIAEQHEQIDKTLLEEIKHNVGQAMADLRDIAKSLSSERLQQVTLSQAVSQELQRMSRGGVMKCTTAIKGTERPLPEQSKIILFRIIQESLQNVLKHAKAHEIHVAFDFDENGVSIAIRDDGSGFDPASAGQTGLGLQNIISRAALIGGTATINSIVNQGTTITLEIPLCLIPSTSPL
ncbi:sensor histidine kinase [Parapedobacter sp. DT-150]|uniref:sensor histidine kinase n=1 Tax=Parapedobacter sp. DT-150 TaxID=3396162 RepID=UPI003F1C8B55